MTVKQWAKHMQDITGATPPSKGGDKAAWNIAVSSHRQKEPKCPDCLARTKSKLHGLKSNWKNNAYKEMGLKKYKGAVSGKYYWEDIYKYGTKDEIEFLLEALSLSGDFISTLSQFRERMGKNPSLKEKYANELKIIDDAMASPSNSKSTNLQNWVINNKEEAKRISDLFKIELKNPGNINKGAFSTTR